MFSVAGPWTAAHTWLEWRSAVIRLVTVPAWLREQVRKGVAAHVEQVEGAARLDVPASAIADKSIRIWVPKNQDPRSRC